ncbi:hypothetical protein MUK42_25408 [Musa troglodytarum]|uniref:Uncharacterized protein n=1 Tax=Musa troglodytarum TaxID=320322 RepID=A0A9E7F0H7_9LILI|nr:hypothetical protein MUK42_25408 [Musa troglodytarum]
MHGGRVPPPWRVLGTATAFIFGGLFTLSLASSVAMRSLQSLAEAKRKKVALPCSACKGKGFYGCKLCNGKSTIEWSPLYDPIVINPCLCPTCEGNRLTQEVSVLGPGMIRGHGFAYLSLKR